MIVPREVGVRFGPAHDTTIFGHLLRRLIEARFEPDESRAALDDTLASWRPALGEVIDTWFDASAVRTGGMLATDRVLFPRPTPWRLALDGPANASPARARFTVPDDQVEPVADFLRGCATGDRAWLEEEGAFLGEDLCGLFAAAGASRGGPPRWPRPEGPGIYRREHASLLIRSRTTGILLDPIALQTRLPHISRAPFSGPDDGVHAVAITHQHADHWSLASLLCVTACAEVPVLVPAVARPNLLSPEDFSESLALAGQSCLAPAWGSTVTVGDIEVDVLPFFGEQPTRDAPGAVAGLRSWGSCYRFNTEDFSVLVLVDSGVDPAGSMVEVVEASHAKRGPVDVVVACMREFPSPFFGGLQHYWAAVPFDRLRELFGLCQRGRLPSTTAGPGLLALLCERARARTFLPYAHGFAGVGRPITDIGWGTGEPGEKETVARLAAELAARGAPTVWADWNPGDVAAPGAGGVAVRSCCSLREDG